MGKSIDNKSYDYDSSERRSFDKLLLIAVGILLPIGLIMVYSASNAVSLEYRGDSYHFFKMQVLWCCIGLAFMLFTAFFNYRYYRNLAFFMLAFSGILLILVYIPGIGVEVGGGKRWIRIWKFSFQPVEIAKLVLIICLARLITQYIKTIKTFKGGILPGMLLLLFFFTLIYKQPDYGSLVIMGSSVFLMLFIGGARIYQLGLLSIGALATAAIGILIEPYRLERLKVFLNPWRDPEGSGYHIIQSFNAINSGGLFGKGLGESIQKLHYLPTPHTDFIFSVIGEEWGFVGSAFIIVMYMLILWRGMHIALTTKNRFGSLLGFGITYLISVQAIINIGVVTGTLPTKGLTLPFISFGGSALLANLAAVGILLNISRVPVEASDFED